MTCDINSNEIEICLKVLEKLASDSSGLLQLDEKQRISLLKNSGLISRPDRNEDYKRRKDIRKAKKQVQNIGNRTARAATGIRTARISPVFEAPLQLTADEMTSGKNSARLNSPAKCYVCKEDFTELHFFYDSMCKRCGDLNYSKRFQTADLGGQTALITGSRLKIGYHATLMLLRAGARVIATTRFPVDSALRFSGEKDFAEWAHRLQIYGLDLRHTPSVEIFCSYIEQKYDRLDILINNAAQTVRRPAGFYSHLMKNETSDYAVFSEDVQRLLQNHNDCSSMLGAVHGRSGTGSDLTAVSWDGKMPGIGIRESAKLSQIPYAYDHALKTEEVFPAGRLDADLQQVDLRKVNSWRLKLGEIQTGEMIEIQLVNAVAPFVLCNRLSSMMKRDFTGKKHIVNVSAMEGKFHRFTKADRHPHTNMAKAALNMLTHTSAAELAMHGIFMNAVDTGWVTDEDPAHLSELKQQIHDFQPPLDIVDGAARVCDPLFDGINTGHHWCGKFLKDYFPIDW